ncbi:MAG: hypothetical protein ACLFUS_08395 [Candidatus Sumerlaeia bacterium]
MFIGTTAMSAELMQTGVEVAFDEMQEIAGINSVLIFAHDCAAYMYRRKHNIDEASGKVIDEIHVRTDPSYYEGLPYQIKRMEDSAFGDRDVLDDAIAAAESRNMDIYARILEAFTITDYTEGLHKVEEVDEEGNPTNKPCLNHPDYLRFVLAEWEDVIRLHPGLKGIKYGQERGGPLGEVLNGGTAQCFCEHCQKKAKDQYGFDLDRTRPGWKALKELAQSALDGEARPADGWMASVLRIWMRYPEILAHTRMWQESREDHRREIYKLGKSINPELEIGWHIDHHWCWSLFGRAALDFADMAPHSDWLSIALYFDAAGRRMAGHFDGGIAHCFLGDLPKDMALDVYRYFAGQNPEKEPSLEAMKNEAPLSADHVYAETKRAVDRVKGKCKIYPRVGFDLPMYNCGTTSKQVEEAVTAALKAGPDGIFLTREYFEVDKDHLRAAAKAIQAFT